LILCWAVRFSSLILPRSEISCVPLRFGLHVAGPSQDFISRLGLHCHRFCLLCFISFAVTFPISGYVFVARFLACKQTHQPVDLLARIRFCTWLVCRSGLQRLLSSSPAQLIRHPGIGILVSACDFLPCFVLRVHSVSGCRQLGPGQSKIHFSFKSWCRRSHHLVFVFSAAFYRWIRKARFLVPWSSKLRSSFFFASDLALRVRRSDFRFSFGPVTPKFSSSAPRARWPSPFSAAEAAPLVLPASPRRTLLVCCRNIAGAIDFRFVLFHCQSCS
jgi:hypothetical protein